jgi:hypothetical protein
MSKSLSLCPSSHGFDGQWTFFDEGQVENDDSFSIIETCHLYDDFRPIPTVC